MNLKDATILVVDDEPELLEIFAVWLGRSGCLVRKAQNGAEAMKILTDPEAKIDTLISDIRMPVMDGITLVRRLFELKLVVPSIIFVSGFGDIDPREAHALGVEAMLAKPLTRKTLLQALEDSLKTRDELWLTPLERTPEIAVELTLPSLAEARAGHEFQIARGGCCFLTKEMLYEDMEIALSIRFEDDDRSLKGQARVRWAENGRAGVEFLYLEPECREWVLAQMTGDAMQSFIPRC